jgi:hypothetical protein
VSKRRQQPGFEIHIGGGYGYLLYHRGM